MTLPRCIHLAALVFLSAVAIDCSSSKKPVPGQMCLLNSECNNPLSCTYGRCHTMCNDTRDCPTGQRCVKGPTGNVCQLAEEKQCPPSMACMQPLICAIDLQCRNNCMMAADCPPGQICASGFCAEPSETTADGKLRVESDGGAISTDAARADTAPMTAADGPAVSADAPRDALSVEMGMVGPCGVPENEPNNTRDQATPLAGTATVPACLAPIDDVDFYELTAPNDASGGYYQISITAVGEMTPELTAYAVADNGRIDALYADSAGQDLNAYLAAAAGQKYRLSVGSFAQIGKAPAKYTIKTTYTKVEDAFEPNNTRETAKPITVGTPIMAFLHDGHRGAKIALEDTVDWYSFSLAAGKATVKVESVPMNISLHVQVFDSTGRDVGSTIGSNAGADTTVNVTDAMPGAYRVSVNTFSVAPSGFNKAVRPGALPDSYTRPYKLTVSQ